MLEIEAAGGQSSYTCTSPNRCLARPSSTSLSSWAASSCPDTPLASHSDGSYTYSPTIKMFSNESKHQSTACSEVVSCC